MEPDTQYGRKKNVIIAIPNPAFGEGLKKHFENEGLNVLGVYVVLEHLIESLHMMKSDSNIKLDGLVLSSSIATKGKDKRLEFLADVIEQIRSDFSETSIIFLSDEMQGHPLLAELVSMGVYNIFAKSTQKSEPLNIKQLIRCIDKPMPYSEVRKFREYNKDIPWRRFINGGRPITISIENSKSNVQGTHLNAEDTSEEIRAAEVISASKEENATVVSEDKKAKPISEQKHLAKTPTDLIEEDLEEEIFWELPPVKPKVIYRDRIIGKQIIAVTGIEKGVGTTHTAILIAHHLANKGYRIKLIECSGNNEFMYIEKAYDGKNVDVYRSDQFEINGVTYVKNNGELDLTAHVTSEHTHIVLDLGCYETTDFIEEFHRADKQIIVGSGSEWKQYTIKRFIESNRDVDQSRWNFVIPLIEKQTISDIKHENDDISVYSIPHHPDPFIKQQNTEEILDTLFNGSHQQKKGKKAKFVLIGVGLLIISAIGLLFILK